MWGTLSWACPPGVPPESLALTEVALAEVADALGASLGWVAPPAAPCGDKAAAV